jgi:hypothetical protein
VQETGALYSIVSVAFRSRFPRASYDDAEERLSKLQVMARRVGRWVQEREMRGIEAAQAEGC